VDRIIADRFVLDRLVGSGGMGEVFRALDRLTGSPVAVKVLHASRSREGDRFKREAQILAEITHPRIVKYVAHGLIEGTRPYLVMEWLDGEDLAERLEGAGLTLHEVLMLARRAAEGLRALHDRGIVHRDIKPSNLFMPGRSPDQLKLLDLGVARLLRTSRPSTQSGVMVGTPGYMAPEQARGAKELDARADIFSLGCVLYEAIASRPAFTAENMAALLAKILLETPPLLREVGIEIPAELDALIGRMLSKQPSARPVDGAALLTELDAFAGVQDSPPQRASDPAIALARPADARASARGVRAITAGERRLVCVVMASLARGKDAHDSSEDLSAFRVETLPAASDPRSVTAMFGAEAEFLADGSFVVTISGRGAASDQAAHAARCALALRAHLGDVPVVLATGLVTVTARSAVGEVLERAAEILASARSANVLVDERPRGCSTFASTSAGTSEASSSGACARQTRKCGPSSASPRPSSGEIASCRPSAPCSTSASTRRSPAPSSSPAFPVPASPGW
jgi:serine/threonine protein kinase